jgi:hypothetical protein
MKLFIGLFIIAAGAGAFFFLRNKKSETNSSFQKELLIGQWKLDSIDVKAQDSAGQFVAFVAVIDSNFYKYRYEVRDDGNILKSVEDSVAADTSYYEWTKKNELAWKENPNDSSEVFIVTKLSSDSLLLQSKGSAVFFFTKLK